MQLMVTVTTPLIFSSEQPFSNLVFLSIPRVDDNLIV